MANYSAARVAAKEKPQLTVSLLQGRREGQVSRRHSRMEKLRVKSFPASAIASSCSAIFPNYVMRLRSKKFNFRRKSTINTYKQARPRPTTGRVWWPAPLEFIWKQGRPCCQGTLRGNTASLCSLRQGRRALQTALIPPLGQPFEDAAIFHLYKPKYKIPSPQLSTPEPNDGQTGVQLACDGRSPDTEA